MLRRQDDAGGHPSEKRRNRSPEMALRICRDLADEKETCASSPGDWGKLCCIHRSEAMTAWPQATDAVPIAGGGDKYGKKIKTEVSLITLFETIKASVSVKQAAHFYGLTFQSNGMARCPFHDDRRPSLKLNEDYFFCFGCGASGDVVDLTAKLFDIDRREAAQKLCQDFEIASDCSATQRVASRRHQRFRGEVLLKEYLNLLRIWRLRYEPTNPREPFDHRFVESCRNTEHVWQLLGDLDSGIPEYRDSAMNVLLSGDTLRRLQLHVKNGLKEESCDRRELADCA